MTTTADFTVFYSHPHYGSESYTVTRMSAEQAGSEAADMLPEDMCEDEDPEDLDLSTIRDDLDVRVYTGQLAAEPTGQKREWVFE